MTVPNLITTLRIILVPIFVIYLIQDRPAAALVVFIIAGLSDGADGLIARLFHQKSRLGAYLDPLADKLLLITGFITLSVKGSVPSWLTVLVLSRDVLILLGVLILFLLRTEFAIKPSALSKLTTCFQLATLFFVLARQYLAMLNPLNGYLLWSTGLLTIASGLHYMYNWFRLVGENSQAG